MTLFRSKKQRFVQAGALALTAALIAGVAAESPRVAEASVYAGEKDARAGVVGQLGELQAEAYATSLTLADSGLSVVAAEDAEAAESSDTQAADTAKREGTAGAEKADEWASRTVANVETSMNVRGNAGEDGSIVGYLRRGDVAQVVSRADGWTEITSGNVHGFVSDAYLLFGAEAEELADSITPLTATSTTDGL
ncbi:MAG: SH3 domain-containing protein, partial [Lachnospiraceae bacterium]|nr:SH3 domain-containing protein [Lachnospiraceae bacterium]